MNRPRLQFTDRYTTSSNTRTNDLVARRTKENYIQKVRDDPTQFFNGPIPRNFFKNPPEFEDKVHGYPVEIIIPIDSSPPDRNIYKYPTASFFVSELSTILHNVTKIELVSIELPNSEPAIRESGLRQNNQLFWRTSEDQLFGGGRFTEVLFGTDDSKIYFSISGSYTIEPGEYQAYIYNTQRQLTSNPISTLNNSPIVSVFMPQSGFSVGDNIVIYGSTSVNGISADVINDTHTITSILGPNLKFNAGVNASASGSGPPGTNVGVYVSPIRQLDGYRLVECYENNKFVTRNDVFAPLGGSFWIDFGIPVYSLSIPKGSYNVSSITSTLNTSLNKILRFNGEYFYFSVTGSLESNLVTFQSIDTTQLVADPLSVVKNDGTITVSEFNQPFAVGDTVTIIGASDLAGIPASLLNTDHIITETTVDTFKFSVNGKANATGSGGGNKVFSGAALPIQLRLARSGTLATPLGFFNEDTGVPLTSNPLRPITYKIASVSTNTNSLTFVFSDELFYDSEVISNQVTNVNETVPGNTFELTFADDFELTQDVIELSQLLLYFSDGSNNTFAFHFISANTLSFANDENGTTYNSSSFTNAFVLYRYKKHHLKSCTNIQITQITPTSSQQYEILTATEHKITSKTQAHFTFDNSSERDLIVTYLGPNTLFCEPIDPITPEQLASTNTQMRYGGSLVQFDDIDSVPKLPFGVSWFIDSTTRNSITIPIPFEITLLNITTNMNCYTGVIEVKHTNHGFNEILSMGPWPIPGTAPNPEYTDRFDSPFNYISCRVPLPTDNSLSGGFGRAQIYYISSTTLEIQFVNLYGDENTIRETLAVRMYTNFGQFASQVTVASIEYGPGAFPDYTDPPYNFVFQVRLAQHVSFPLGVSNFNPNTPGQAFTNPSQPAIQDPTSGYYGINGFIFLGSQICVSAAKEYTNTFSVAFPGTGALQLFPTLINDLDSTYFTNSISPMTTVHEGTLDRKNEVSFARVVNNDLYTDTLLGIPLELINDNRYHSIVPISKDTYFIECRGYFTDRDSVWCGGSNVFVSSERHGFGGKRSNTVDWNSDSIVSRALSLEGENYLFLQSQLLDTVVPASKLIGPCFAKLRMTESPNHLVFDGFVSSPKVFSTPLTNLSTLDFSVVSRYGDYYDFNGHDYSMTLKVTYISNQIVDSGINTHIFNNKK